MKAHRAILVLALLTSGCLVDQRCVSNQDCPGNRICNADGHCVWECVQNDDCGAGFVCTAHRCEPEEHEGIACPADMVNVKDLFCIDRYEASRPDATMESPGSDESMAVSRADVLPWRLDEDHALAAHACEAAGKRLCSPFEWELACRGPDMTTYGYGATYDPAICNGIDTFGANGIKLLPTGAMGGCVNGWGAWDMNGNLWEHVSGGDASTVRGGAYNCIDSMSLHRCDYVPSTWVPSALGFRCCLTPTGGTDLTDVRSVGDLRPADIPATESGCLDPDVPLIPDTPVDVEPECTVDDDCFHLTSEDDCLRPVCSAEGSCELAPAQAGTACSDADPCTVGDACLDGDCVPGNVSLECSDANPCTDDSCEAGVGCQYAPNQAMCDDGDPCTLGDLCSEGDCQPGDKLKTCDDGNPCTDDECVTGAGCQSLPNQETCDDGNPCTDPDLCADGTCASGLPICSCEVDGDCPADADLCNGNLICDTSLLPYACVVEANSVVDCPPSGNPCQVAWCVPETGACEFKAAADGIECDDGNDCTGGDACQSGLCEGAVALCQCESDDDCQIYEDDNGCNGTLVCSKETFPYKCMVDSATVVTCPPASGPCKENLCQPATGQCVESAAQDGTSCDDGNECNGDDHCLSGSCVSGTEVLCACPQDMVTVNDQFCLDRYEASRPDATAGSMGFDTSQATSQAGVIPWFPVSWAEAKVACEAADKRLCTTAEIQLACSGSAGTNFVYGNAYSADICNGIDAFCYCDQPPCSELAECPYPHCRSMSPAGVYGEGCGAYFHVTPTGAFPDCVNEWGAFDINGNVWELVDTGSSESWYKGGAYNCSDSEFLHQCNGLFQNISAKGFRCCKEMAP